jgi:hypothetical protein
MKAYDQGTLVGLFRTSRRSAGLFLRTSTLLISCPPPPLLTSA